MADVARARRPAGRRTDHRRGGRSLARHPVTTQTPGGCQRPARTSATAARLNRGERILNTPEYQPPLPPEADCAHGTDNAALGRFDLMDISAGLAVDLHDDGEVTVYMLHAFNVAYGGGGVSYAWVTHEERLTTEPDVVIAEPTEPVAMATQEIADFCELASGLATALRPVVERAIDLDAPEALYAELGAWLERFGAGPKTWRFVIHVVRLLALALMKRKDKEDW